MIRAYEELAEFIAAGHTTQEVARFELSPDTREKVADLIHREKTSGLSEAERSELDHYLQIEHVMRLAKARARGRLANDQLCPS